MMIVKRLKTNQLLAEYNYEHSTTSSNEDMYDLSASSRRFWIISFSIGFALGEFKRNSLTRIIFRAKSIIVLTSLSLDLSGRLYCHSAGIPGGLVTLHKVKHVIHQLNIEVEVERSNRSNINVANLVPMAKDFALLLEQGMGFIFFYFIHNCTCDLRVLKDPMKGIVKAIALSFVMLFTADTLQYVAMAFLPVELAWVHQLNGIILPLGKFLTTIIVLAMMFLGIKTLLTMTESHNF